MMANGKHFILVETIKRLLRRGFHIRLKKLIGKVHAADLSAIFPSLSATHQRLLFRLIEDREQQAIVLSELDEDIIRCIIEDLNLDEITDIIENMASDDAAALIKRLPPEKADPVIARLRKIGEDVEGLKYPKDSAGAIMITDFIALYEGITAGEVISTLQTKEYKDVEMPFYIYVVDEQGHLAGVCSLRQLVLVPPATPLRDIMTSDVISVTTGTDQEEVAAIVARYDFLAVPVVDNANRLVGLVTVDDVIDIFREEATEDILKMAGAGQEFVETKSVYRSTRIRIPWLFASYLGGIVAFFIIGHFEADLKQVSYLAAFIPVIMGMGGNVGIQSSTIVVRGLATGRIMIQDIWRVVSKELAVGLILGAFYGVLVAFLAHFQYDLIGLTVAVCVGILTSMSMAAIIGSLLPMLFARINIDPAVATGPFVTSAIDILSVYFYFQLATLLLGI